MRGRFALALGKKKHPRLYYAVPLSHSFISRDSYYVTLMGHRIKPAFSAVEEDDRQKKEKKKVSVPLFSPLRINKLVMFGWGRQEGEKRSRLMTGRQ